MFAISSEQNISPHLGSREAKHTHRKHFCSNKLPMYRASWSAVQPTFYFPRTPVTFCCCDKTPCPKATSGRTSLFLLTDPEGESVMAGDGRYSKKLREHIFNSTQKAKRIGSGAIKSQSLASETYFLQQGSPKGSIRSPNSAIHWGPSTQIPEVIGYQGHFSFRTPYH